jgi:hypothetical protein
MATRMRIGPLAGADTIPSPFLEINSCGLDSGDCLGAMFSRIARLETLFGRIKPGGSADEQASPSAALAATADKLWATGKELGLQSIGDVSSCSFIFDTSAEATTVDDPELLFDADAGVMMLRGQPRKESVVAVFTDALAAIDLAKYKRRPAKRGTAARPRLAS